MDELTPTDEEIAYVRKTIEDIRRLGPGALLAQYAIWANLHVDTLADTGRGAAGMRTMQALPVCHYLMGMSGCEDASRVQAAMHDSVVRALWHAKTNGRDRISSEDARAVMQDLVDALSDP